MTGPGSGITPLQWRTLFAAQAGWMLDAMDVMLYAFALASIQEEFGLDAAGAGWLASTTLVFSALGGIAFGFLADRFGRVRMLVVSILAYSVFTGLTAGARSVMELAVCRALVGIGLGGEWTAGSVLVAETWPAEHRGKAIGFMQSGWAIGYALAAVLAALVLPSFGWRPLFVIGVLPALLAVWVRARVPEPEIWQRSRGRAWDGSFLKPPLLARTIPATALATCLLFAYWGLFTWIPSFLAQPVERGGAGLGVVRSLPAILLMQLGAFLGYALFGVLSDRFGRRIVFVVFVAGAALSVPLYAMGAQSVTSLLLLGPVVGFFGHGYFSVFGAMLSEMFPSSVRAAAQGFCYNAGRAASATAPWLIGALADRRGIASALTVTSLFFCLGAVLVMLLPETRGETLR